MSGSPTASLPRLASALRREISARNLQRASRFVHEATYSETPSVVYAAADGEAHGNFFPASYRRILATPWWRERLAKAYTASGRLPHAERRQRYELDCATSSDALLMNIFCHPTTLASVRLRSLLNVTVVAPEFGVRARVPLLKGAEDRTEIDMRLQTATGSLFVEAKLSESDFQVAREDLVRRYRDLDEVFDVSELPRRRGQFVSYQLVRNVLAAFHHGAAFAVFLDGRRTDLVEDAFRVYRAVVWAQLRSRLHVVTWQEIAACVSRNLQRFLAEKYGIEAAR